jgi:AAHS family 4-hydroxybenzoate transporter-like MFS transporter
MFLEAAMSHTESRLENQSIGALQVRVILLCTLAQLFDGFDITSISMAVPALIRVWQQPGSAFANTFVMSSVGIMIGALASGPIGDRVGRKPVMIGALLILGITSLACTQAHSISELVIYRLFTGIGIGAVMPVTVALSGDYVPNKIRAVMIMIMFTGSPLGGFLGKQIVAQLLPIYGWTSIFWIGGLAPLALIPVMLLCLPESPRFLLSKGRLTDGTRRLLDRLGIDPTAPSHPVDVVQGNPIAGLFRDGLGPTTILIWLLYFANLMSLYLVSYWMPTVLSLSGLTPPEAVAASSFADAGPLISIFLVVPLSARFGPPNVLTVMLFTGILSIGAIGLINLPYTVLLVVLFLIGACTVGAMTGINGFTGALYPARVRNTGMGWALGIGRLGGIAGPWLGGYLLSQGWPPRQIFLATCLTASMATITMIVLGVRGRRQAARVLREA